MVLPAVIPVTLPVLLTVAMVGSALVQVPPVVASLKVAVAPAQMVVVVPVIAAIVGIAFTVFIAVTVVLQPVDPSVTLYPIVAVPAVRPVTMPDVLIVAVAGALLLQVPPGVASLRVVVLPAHSLAVPVIAATAGPASVVNVVDAEAVQPAILVTLYIMVVLPIATGVTVADDELIEPLIVATVTSVLPHTPPVVASFRIAVMPVQAWVVPVIAATTGKADTALPTVRITLQPDKPV